MRLPHCVAFFITYLGLLTSMEKKLITLKTQPNAENASENRVWQLGLNIIKEVSAKNNDKLRKLKESLAMISV